LVRAFHPVQVTAGVVDSEAARNTRAYIACGISSRPCASTGKSTVAWNCLPRWSRSD
jgi:hypothetical protein